MSFACIVSLVLFVPDSSIPDEIPNFVGREKACKSIEDHLTDSVTRLVNVWGPPGFGKTSAAIRVAHRLQKKNIPVYFASLRGMESKEDLVSKLLSMFVDDKQVGRISSSHFSIQCLQRVQNPFVLMLDNADDLLGSGDTKRNDQVLQFIEEILTHCKQIKLLLTTRESLDYLNQKLPMYSEKINVLDKISSEDLVRLLLPDASDDDCNFIVRECGNVPMSMRLMCSIIKEESISIDVLLQELNNSTLVEVLDHEYLPDGFRIKSVMNKSFKTLMVRERDAFVSLSVFPERFGVEEAQAILNEKSEVQTKQIIRSLERKSLIDCGENFSHFTIHSLFRSFIQEETKNDQAVEAVFRNSQIQFYDYYISRCKVANEHFLKERYGDAFRDFLDRRSSIISSLSSGPRIDRIYSKVVELLSEAKSFLSVALHDEQMLLERLYDTAIEKAKTMGNLGDKQRLQSARECHSAESFFWLSRVQREGGNLKGAMESARVGSRLRKERLGHSPYRAVSYCHRGVTHDVMGNSDVLVEAFQKAAEVAKLLDSLTKLASYYNLEGSRRRYHLGNLGGLQDEAYMSLHKNGVREDTARCFHRLAREQREAGDLIGALKSVQVGVRLRQQLSGGHPGADSVFFEQGQILLALGDSKSAVEAFQRAADMSLNLRGYDISTAQCYLQLGIAQSKMQDLQGALKSLQRARSMRSHLLQNNTKDAALTYYMSGIVQQDTGDLKGALESLQSAANIRSNLLGDHRDTALAYYMLGLVQRDMGDFGGALESLQHAAKIGAFLPGDHSDTALAYYMLGLVQSDMGDLEGALKSLQHAANIRSNVHGDHRDTALAYYMLGLVQRDMGDFGGALESLQRAAKIRAFLLGDHRDTALAYYMLGLVQSDMGDFGGALKSLQHAADIRSFRLGNNRDTALAYYMLGLVQRDMGDLKNAMESLQTAADTRLALADFKDTALTYFMLGLVQRDMGDLKKAMESFQNAANLRSDLLGDHKETAFAYYTLGLVQRAMGDLKGALESLQKAANMESNVLGDHEDTAYSYHWLGLVQRGMGDLKGARSSLQKAANIRSGVLGEHTNTASSYFWFGLVQREMGDHKGAVESLQRAANMRSDAVGDHKHTAYSYYWLGLVQYDMGDLKGARDSLQIAANMRSIVLGDYKDTAYIYYLLGLVQRDMGDLKGSRDSLQIAAVMTSNVRADHEDTAYIYYLLGLVQRDIGDLQEARDSLQKATNMRSNGLGDHEDTARSYHELGVVQHGMGDLKAASKSLEKATNMRLNLLGDHHEATISSLNEFRAVRVKLRLESPSLLGKVFQWKNRHKE